MLYGQAPRVPQAVGNAGRAGVAPEEIPVTPTVVKGDASAVGSYIEAAGSIVAREESLQGLLEKLDSAVSWESVDPENISEYLSITGPLEAALRSQARAPEATPGSEASQLAACLWIKHHPERADLEFLAGSIRHPLAIIRFAAVTALNEVFEARGGADGLASDPSAGALHRAIEDQRLREASTMVAFQLQRLAERLRHAARSRQRRRPKLHRNPYIAGGPIRSNDGFYGRGELLEELRRTLSGTTSVIVYGARRTGKTSLLYRIRDGALGDDFFPVYIDMQAVAGTPLHSFLNFLAKSVDEALWEAELLEGQALPRPDGETDFSFLRKLLAKAAMLLDSRRLLLLIDEYELLKDYVQDKNAARQFQSIMEGPQGPQLIFAGSQRVEELDSKNLLTLLDVSKDISFLSTEDARQLIVEPAREALEFHPDAVESILTLTAGHPYYTQLICHALFDQLGGSGTVRPEHVEHAARGFVHNPAPHLVLTWKNLSLSQKAVCSSIAELQHDATTSVRPDQAADRLKERKLRLDLREMREAIGELRRLDWLRKEEDEDRFSFIMDLVRRWVAEKKTIWDLIREYRQEAYSKLATPRRRVVAWSLDLAALALLWLLTFFAGRFLLSGSPSADLVPLVTAFLVAIYLLMFLLLESATLGMLICRLHHVTGQGFPLRLPRKLALWLLLTVRQVLWLYAVFYLVKGVGPAALVSGLLLALYEGVNSLTALRDDHRRNLVNRLTDTLVVHIPAERKT